MAELQQRDPETKAYRTAVTDLKWSEVDLDGVHKLLCDTSQGGPRPLVPAEMRCEVFELVHGLSHPGTNATVKIMKSRFVWHGLAKDVREWARGCVACQSAKVHRHNKAPLHKFEKPSARFAHVHVDLVGPLPLSQGCSHLLTVIDRFTRWPEAIPLARTDATSVGRAFALHWVARFGVPIDMTSDRGPQFTSDIWRALSEMLGTKLHRTTAYHPQANGIVERFHRSLKAALRARLTSSAWMDDLPWVLLGLRTAPKDDMGASVAEMVYGASLAVPGAFFAPGGGPEASEHLQRMRDIAGRMVPAPDAWHNTRSDTHSPRLAEAEFVFIRRDGSHGPLQTPYTGPYRVLERKEKYFRLQCGEREETVSVDRLKPAFADPDQPIQPAIPPRRGRPPKAKEATPGTDKKEHGATKAETRQSLVPDDDNDEEQAAAGPEPEQEAAPPTYAQVTKRGRQVRPPQRYGMARVEPRQ